MFNFYLTYGAILFALKALGIGEEKKPQQNEAEKKESPKK